VVESIGDGEPLATLDFWSYRFCFI